MQDVRCGRPPTIPPEESATSRTLIRPPRQRPPPGRGWSPWPRRSGNGSVTLFAAAADFPPARRESFEAGGASSRFALTEDACGGIANLKELFVSRSVRPHGSYEDVRERTLPGQEGEHNGAPHQAFRAPRISRPWRDSGPRISSRGEGGGDHCDRMVRAGVRPG